MPNWVEIGNWAGANPMYVVGGLAGLALGIFYGFDGWRGSTKDLEFKDSPRVKNLLWVLGGAFTAVIGDVRAVDPTAKKPVLLLSYFVAFFIGAASVVVVWGFVVLVDAARSGGRLRHAYTVLDGVGDYFYFGYRNYRDHKDQIAMRQRASFLEDYLTQLSYSITIAGSKIPANQRTAVARNILRSMAAVVRKYRGENSKALIRINLMMARSCTAELRSKLRFTSERQEVEQCLELVVYDSDEEQRDFLLPLPKSWDVKDALPGAPIAFVGEMPVIVDDTGHIDFPESISPKLKTALRQYFASKQAKFKSFASLRVVGGGAAIAVVNVESSEKHVFGVDDAEKKEFVEYLFPFCSTLGILLNES